MNVQRVTLFCLVVGTLLRVVWPADMEWKADERWLFEKSQAVRAGGSWPAVGMPSSQGTPNPGFSAWLFVLLGRWSASPLALVGCVQWLNVLVLWGFYFFIRRCVRRHEQPQWLLGLALFSLSLLPVVYSRKIWQQCLLPPFVLLFFWAHRRRSHWLGAFFWGVAASLIFQIHMAGVFFALAWVIWTVVAKQGVTRWRMFFLGGVIASLLCTPWIYGIVTGRYPSPPSSWRLGEIFQFKLWRYWLSDAWGITAPYLFKGADVMDFYRAPRIGDWSLWLVGALHGAAVLLGMAALVYWIVDWLKGEGAIPKLSTGYFKTAFFGYGGILTLLAYPAFPHYWIMCYPLLHLWAVNVAWRRPWIVYGQMAVQGGITASFLWYVHVHGGIRAGEYGPTYRVQQIAGDRLPPTP